LILALLLFAASFTDTLWSGIRTIYDQTLQHPFLRGLSAGTLPKDRFQFYLVQDAQYLGAFGDALRGVAEKAPREDWAATLRRHADDAIKVERQLHEGILTAYGVPRDAQRAPMAPTNYAYTNHLLMASSRGSFGEGLAALLPCYWIYWEVGKELKKRGSRDPQYKKWIDQYSSNDYAKVVAEVLAIMDSEAANLSPAERVRAVDWFILSARYEYMFWDMAWRLEAWPPAPGVTTRRPAAPAAPPKPVASPKPVEQPPKPSAPAPPKQ
jgi:thiaminase/transcriptional activator TenA